MTDVVVVGGGIAGLAAGITAAEAGARVLLLEKDRAVGGNARWAYGFDIEGADLDEMRAANPDGDPALQRLLLARFAEALRWLGERGVRLEESEPGRFTYLPCHGDGGLLAFAALTDAFVGAGGEIRTGVGLHSLLTADGAVTGVLAAHDDREIAIPSAAVVLATGGFGGSASMRRQFFGGDGDLAGFYGTTHHDGDGIRAAVAIGATVTAGAAVPAGACIFAPPFAPPGSSHRFGPGDARSLEPVPATIQALLVRPPVCMPGVVLLNLEGRRYVDESSPYSLVGWQTTSQTRATALCVFDQTTYDEHRATLDLARQYGAVIHRAGSLDALARLAASSGPHALDADAMAATLRDFNRAAGAGAAADLQPPRRDGARPLERAPFHAVRVVQGVNDTAGGLAVDEGGRVLDARNRPIGGLWAAGADAGRPYSFEHGGLAYGLILGREAGAGAASFASSAVGAGRGHDR